MAELMDDDPKTARCMKCGEEKEVAEPRVEESETKTGKTRRTLKGECADCGTGMNRFLPSRD